MQTLTQTHKHKLQQTITHKNKETLGKTHPPTDAFTQAQMHRQLQKQLQKIQKQIFKNAHAHEFSQTQLHTQTKAHFSTKTTTFACKMTIFKQIKTPAHIKITVADQCKHKHPQTLTKSHSSPKYQHTLAYAN